MSTIAPYRRELKGPVAFTELVSCSKSAELTLRRRGTSRRGLSQARFHRGVVVQVRRERFVYPAGASPAPIGSSRSVAPSDRGGNEAVEAWETKAASGRLRVDRP
jgi:hypothetical protein